MYFSAYYWEKKKIFAGGEGGDFLPQFKGGDKPALDF